jgi:hypothetical protein
MLLFERRFSSPDLELYPTSNGYDLKWNPALGIGYLPTRGYEYDTEYWEHYSELSSTAIGVKLTAFRKSFVIDNLGGPGDLCDVGIGSGSFVKAMSCKGYDVNPHAKRWLEKNGSFGNPHERSFDTLTFWDVLEHIDDPTPLLVRPKHVFVSMPIFPDVAAVLASKHLKPDEHLWYYTEPGLKTFMKYFGFELVSKSDEETKIGRESIMAYFFTRDK